jgi:hypothetical protein
MRGDVVSAPARPQYTGHIARGDAPDRIVGLLRDAWGYTIHIEGTRTADGYELIGIPDVMPDALRIPLLDGEKE